MYRGMIKYSGFLIVLFVFTSIVFASTLPSKIESLRQSVLALDSAWTRANKDLQEKKSAGSLQDSELKDYAKFITYLSGRIDYYCSLLQQEGGEQAVADLPCAEKGLADADPDKPPAKTKAEQVAALDQSLSSALGEFDEQLLKEEQRIASRTPNVRESVGQYDGRGGAGGNSQYGGSGYGMSGGMSGTGQMGASGGMQGASSPQNGQQGAQGNQGAQGAQGTAESSYGGQGAGAGTGSHEQRADNRTGTTEITSGYDDIVARQLREAAEKEADPELKKKLWEEYRKYKEGTR